MVLCRHDRIAHELTVAFFHQCFGFVDGLCDLTIPHVRREDGKSLCGEAVAKLFEVRFQSPPGMKHEHAGSAAIREIGIDRFVINL